MSTRQKNEFENIIKDIINNSNFREIDNDVHHGTTKFQHCQRVAVGTYNVTKFLGLDYVAATRSALLHDFFVGKTEGVGENSYLNHPDTSVINAKKYFVLSEHETDIIRTHMFHHIFIKKILRFINPNEDAKLLESRPKSAEGWVVCLVDMFASLYEWLKFKVGQKAYYQLNILVLFMFFLITSTK